MTWNADEVHVEREFEVQVKVRYTGSNSDGWWRVARVAANSEAIEFSQPANGPTWTIVTTAATATEKGSKGTYRVVSLTDALGTNPATAESTSAPAVHETPTVGATEHDLQVTHGRNGTVLPASLKNTTKQKAGTTVRITADPDDGYEVNRWSGACSGSETVCDVKMDGPKRVHVTFKAEATVTCWDGTTAATLADCPVRPNYRLTVTASGGGSASGTGDYPAKTTATALATWNNTTHSFEGWSGACTHTNAACNVKMDGPRKAHATFTLRTTTYELHVTHGQNGDVSPEGKTRHAEGRTVTITADPDTGYVVNVWSGDCGGSAVTCDVKMDGDRRVHVTFKAEADRTVTCWDGTTAATLADCPVRPRYRLTVTASGGGSASGTGDYLARTTATARATWNAATHTFEGWSGACSHKRATCSVFMSGARSAHATFAAKPKTKTCPTYTLTVTASGGGRVSGGGTYGGSVVGINDPCPTVRSTATASWNATTHTFSGWSGACSHTSASCTVTNVTTSAHATFAAKPKTKTCPTYTFRVLATGGGSVTGGGTYGGAVVPVSATCTASSTATASWNNTTHSFEGWRGACTHTSPSCTVRNSNRSATAYFKKRPPPEVKCLVTVKAGPNGTAGGGGSVTCGKGSVTIWARAGTGYCFNGWVPVFGRNTEDGQDGETCTPFVSQRVTPQLDTTYTAYFRRATPIYYTLTVTGGSGSGSYEAGTYATASASAGRCFLGVTYTFKRWSGDSTSTSRVISLYMNRNKAVTAVYTTGGSCQLSEESEAVDDGGGPPWTEPPATEPADDS